MAAASADLENLRKAINSLRPDEPNLAASFSAEDFQALLREGYGTVNDLKDTSGAFLRKMGLDEARVTDIKPGSWPSDLGSLGELLRTPLPDADFIGSPSARHYHGDNHETHPLKVEEWPAWEEEVKARLQNGTQGWTTEGYTLIGNDADACIANELGVLGALVATAGVRLNCIFRRHNLSFRFTARPDLQATDRGRGHAQREPVEVPEMNRPDLCLVDNIAHILRMENLLQTTVCRSMSHLVGAEHWSMPALWTAWKDGKAVHDAIVAENVEDALAEALGFMSRSGHVTGTISTYYHTWLLRTDKKGMVKVTPAIRHDQKGTRTKVSVTEMLLYSALSNIYSKDKEPYPTAKYPGVAPSSCKSVKALRKRAFETVNERSAGSANV